MYTDDDIDAAVAAGILNAQTAARFRQMVADRSSSSVVDEEHFRLLTGFNDIFVTIAAILVLMGLAWLGNSQAAGVAGVLVAAASWGLAEYFTRRRRMAMPSILLLGSFVGGAFFAAKGQLAAVDPMTPGFAAAAVAAGAHWLRFRVPITVAAGTCTGLAAVAFTVISLWHPPMPGIMAMAMLGGLATFALAMRWDAGDRTRTTRRSDVAFWLHLAAAPAIIHPTFSLLGLLEPHPGLYRAAVAVAVYLALTVVALAVDRRALLVSALAYVLYAVSDLLKSGAIGESMAVTTLTIGSALLLLSALWHGARQRVLALLPATLLRRLPAA